MAENIDATCAARDKWQKKICFPPQLVVAILQRLSRAFSLVARCQRRNRLKQDVAASISFFKKHLKNRDFDMKCFDRLVARFQTKRVHGTRQRESVRKAFLKVFNKNVSSRWLSNKIRKFMPLRKQSVPSIQAGTCWSIGSSLFRRRYAEVWNFVGQAEVGHEKYNP